MKMLFGKRMRTLTAALLCCSMTPALAADASQLPRDDSTGPGAAVGNSQAPWNSAVESVRQQIPISIANARTETSTWSCGAGYAGARFQTRLVKTFTNGVVQADAWSAVQGECVPLPNASSGSIKYIAIGSSDSGGHNGTYRMCPIGFSGDPYRGESGCFSSSTCPVGVLTPVGYSTWQSGSGEGTGAIITYVSSALCITP
jgi:hypothetical protein